MAHNLKIAALMLLLTLACGSATAQSASQILGETAKIISSAPSVSASFSTVSPEAGNEKGTLLMAHQNFAMVTPKFGVWYDGENMWSYYQKNGECNLTEPSDDEVMEVNPFDIVTQYDRNYSATLEKKTKTEYTIRLTPLSQASEVKTATVVIDVESKLPKAIDARFRNGAAIAISLTNVTIGETAPPKSQFQFPEAKYPGVEVIDLR